MLENLTLHNGVKMPWLGLGVFLVKEEMKLLVP
ncbi:diketogulonate reductase-like aldo/keto reductase [Neobacillus cucumis]|nr:diketogulonate reductase-like aldo/keto reductase [Neobacillus cucumis]